MDQPTKDISIIEKHGQTILTALILAGIIWVIKEVDHQSKNAIVLNGKIETMGVQIKNLEATLNAASVNRYTSIDAESTARLRNAEHNAMNMRIDANDKRITTLESKR